MRLLLLLVAALITYGSLYPFRFSLVAVDSAAIAAFLNSLDAPSGRGDILGNVVLFIPFGFLGMLALPPRSNRATRILSTVITGFVLSTALQVAQLYLPSRTAVLVDVVWNMVGLGMGIVVAMPKFVQGMVANQSVTSTAFIPAVIIAAWLAARLAPFVPSIDWQEWKDSLKPLLLDPSFDLRSFLRQAPAWLATACLSAAAFGERRISLKFALLIAVTFALEVIIIDNTLSFTAVVSASSSFLVFALALKHLRRRELVAGLILMGTYVYLGLTPFILLDEPKSFHWIPFWGSLGGSMFVNAWVICYKVFLYGAMVWLLERGGLGNVGATMLTFAAATIVEAGQAFTGSGTPEITDPLLVLVAGLLIANLGPRLPSAIHLGRATNRGEFPGSRV